MAEGVAGRDAAGVAVAEVADETKRERSIRGGKRGGRRPQRFPIVTFPALALVDTPNASRFIPRTSYFSNSLLRPTLI
jgi:hypothetical protein